MMPDITHFLLRLRTSERKESSLPEALYEMSQCTHGSSPTVIGPGKLEVNQKLGIARRTKAVIHDGDDKR